MQEKKFAFLVQTQYKMGGSGPDNDITANIHIIMNIS